MKTTPALICVIATLVFASCVIETQTDTIPPSTPMNLEATVVSSRQINLVWSASTDDVGVAGYKVYRDGIYIQSVVGTIYADNGLTASTQYCYAVTAYDQAGNESALGNQQCQTTLSPSDDTQPPSVPTGLVAAASSSSRINLSWSASTDNEQVTGYKIFRDAAYLKTVSGAAATDMGLSPDTQYCYTVSAIDPAGNESAQSSEACATTQAEQDLQAPSVPTGLLAAAASSTRINLSWNASTDNLEVTGYRVYWDGLYLKTVSGTATADRGLSPSTQYCYTVSAIDAAGNESAQSSEACATTLSDSQAVVLSPQYDNLVMVQSNDSSVENTVYQNAELAVGCDWIYSDITGIQDYLCAESLVWFDISSLVGRTIEIAILELEVIYAGDGSYPQQWHVRAMASEWSPYEVTWIQVENSSYYTGSEIIQDPPIYAGQFYEIDVTDIVQEWAYGYWDNYGLIFGSSDYIFPYDTSSDAFAFYSLEDIGRGWPRLIVIYY